MEERKPVLQAATRLATGEVLIVFDADYLPGKSLLKFLAAPSADLVAGSDGEPWQRPSDAGLECPGE